MSTKETNPKDIVGTSKPPLSTLPSGPLYEAAAALLEGGLKYGRHNYRVMGVRASIYFDAAMGHLWAWWEGEDLDDDSGIHHISKAIAGLMVLRDAQLEDNCDDDRPPSTQNYRRVMEPLIKDIITRNPNPLPPYRQDGGGE